MVQSRLSIEDGVRPLRGNTLPWRAIAAAATIGAASLLPAFVGEYWLKGLLIPALIYSLSALGLNLVTGYAGLISLGQAAFMALGAFFGVIGYGRYGIPLLPSILLAGIGAALVGALVGFPSLRIRGLYLMVSTLAAQFIITWLIQRVPWFGAGSFGTVNTPPVALAGIAIDTPGKQYLLALAVVALLAIFGANLARSRVGRAWIAIRERETAASLMGISLVRYKVMAFAISGFYAGVAGALVVFTWVGAANVQEYDLEVSIHILGMIIIGGLGSIAGAFLGAFFVTLLPIFISVAMHAVYQRVGGSMISSTILANAEHVVFGSLIIFFLIVEPYGLARLVRVLAAQARRTTARWQSTGRSEKNRERRR